jgi:hypothetical protein
LLELSSRLPVDALDLPLLGRERGGRRLDGQAGDPPFEA